MILLDDQAGNCATHRIRGQRWLRVALLLVMPCIALSCLAVEKLTSDWSINIDAPGGACPAIAPDGTIYFGTFTGRLWAVQPNGSRKWIFRAGLEIKSSPALGADGSVYFGSRDRKCYALLPNGKKKWEYLTGGWVDSSPALATDGAIVFGSWDKIFYALNPDGTQRWQFTTTGPIVSSPAIGPDGTIYFGSHDNKFYALEPNGHKKWEYTTGGPIISSPALNQTEAVYFTSVDGYCYALNFDGSLRWRLRTGGVTESSPVIGSAGAIYVGVNKQLWAITRSGEKIWERNVDDFMRATPIILADSSIGFQSGWGVLINIEPDGAVNWIREGASYESPAVAPTGVLYLFDSTSLTSVRSKVPLAGSAWPKFRGNLGNTGNTRDLR